MATFKQEVALTVTAAGDGAGTVRPVAAGTTAVFDWGTTVPLTATAAAGSRFTGWSGDCRGSALTCSVTMTQARSVTATFRPVFRLTVTNTGGGLGVVRSAPTGISCGATCSALYLPNTAVSLTASPAAGVIFLGWSGACTGTGACSVTMTQAQNVTATFVTNSAPTVGTLSPSTVTSVPGVARSFSALYSDANGVTNLKTVDLRVGGTAANAIYARYDVGLNRLFLFNDTGTAVLPTSCVPGSAGTIENTQGMLNCTATTATAGGTDLTVAWNLTPKPAFTSAAARGLWAIARDAAAATSGFVLKGTWLIDTTPTVGTLTPSTVTSASGVAQSFNAVYSDADSATNLKTVELRVGGTAANAIYARYDRTLNLLYLFNDAGTAVLPTGCAPGSAGTIANTQGILDCAATTVTAIGTSVTVAWNLTPKPAFVSTTPRGVWLIARDAASLTSGWVLKGTWKIQ
jgi:List-Bact-rpt repeat protein